MRFWATSAVVMNLLTKLRGSAVILCETSLSVLQLEVNDKSTEVILASICSKHCALTGMVCMQGIITVPVVVWLFVVQPISLRTMHDDEDTAGQIHVEIRFYCM